MRYITLFSAIIGAMISTSALAAGDPIPFDAATCKNFHGFAAVVDGQRVCMTGPQHRVYHGPVARPQPNEDKYPDGIAKDTKHT